MSLNKRHFLFIVIVLIATFIFQSDAPLGDLFADMQGENIVGMGNPSAVYCQEMGYQYQIVSDESGESGICQLPDDTTCDAWSFLQGECGQEYSYCAQQGLDMIIKHDGKNGLTQIYAVCVDEDQVEQGNVVEMLELDQKSLGCGVGLEESFPLDLAEAEPAQPLDFVPPPAFDWRNYLGGDWLTP
ncbi:MAG: DUF333 domain-containing protein, partial [Anaerolineales bacterium]|nr:DUF333 domain-containing protein [Anaerolineales bacterium]